MKKHEVPWALESELVTTGPGDGSTQQQRGARRGWGQLAPRGWGALGALGLGLCGLTGDAGREAGLQQPEPARGSE